MEIGLQILEQLCLDNLSPMNIAISFHIKGQQYTKTTKVENLPLPAQLIIKAYELALESSKDKYIPEYYTFRVSKVNICFNNIAIKSNVADIWGRAHLNKDFCDYINKRRKWKPNTAAKI